MPPGRYHSLCLWNNSGILLYRRTRLILRSRTGRRLKREKKRYMKLLGCSLLDHLKCFECFPSYSNILISEEPGQMVNCFLVADFTEKECCPLSHITLIVLQY